MNRRQAAYALALLLGVAVAAVGYASSFNNLSAYAAAHGWWLPQALPLGLDLGIPALLILDWLRASMFLRSAAWSLAAFTVFANGAVAGGNTVDRLLHAMMPAVAILIVEAARHLRDDPARMDKIRLSRWLLSPVRTARLQRRMVLWEITSYSEALARESAILHARTVLAVAHGCSSWGKARKLVPLTLRHQLGTGQIPSSVLYGPDLQTAVRDWVRATMEELALERPVDPRNAARSEHDAAQDSRAPAASRWDLIWDLQDSVRPDGVPGVVFAQAIGMARYHFEQVGAHLTNEDLQDRLRIGKARANAIGKALRTSFETGPDLGVRNQDPAPDPGFRAVASADLIGTSGLVGGLASPGGGVS